jgi:hypothetical protein
MMGSFGGLGSYSSFPVLLLPFRLAGFEFEELHLWFLGGNFPCARLLERYRNGGCTNIIQLIYSQENEPASIASRLRFLPPPAISAARFVKGE